jgi:hypothetical protein
MAVATVLDERGAQVRIETGRGIVTQVDGLGVPLTAGLHRNYRVTIRATHSASMRYPVTALTMAGQATLAAAFAALASQTEVGYEVQVRRRADIDEAIPLDVLRATAESARGSVRRILVRLGDATSDEAVSLAATSGERRCA